MVSVLDTSWFVCLHKNGDTEAEFSSMSSHVYVSVMK